MSLIGRRVRWAEQGPIACFAPPCTQTPGTVVEVTRETPGKFKGGFVVGPSGFVVSVKHDDDNYPPLDWPAESLVTVGGNDDGKALLASDNVAVKTAPNLWATILVTGAFLGVGLWFLRRRSH